MGHEYELNRKLKHIKYFYSTITILLLAILFVIYNIVLLFGNYQLFLFSFHSNILALSSKSSLEEEEQINIGENYYYF